MQIILDATRTALALCFLFYASWSDYKTREVSNSVWMLFAPLAFALAFFEIYVYEFSQLSFYGMCFGLTTLFAVIIFYSGGFGGADAKALMCLALVLPFYPYRLLQPLSREISPISQLFFPLAVFNNSVLLAALTAVGMLVYNISWHMKTRKELFAEGYENKSLGRKTLILITGYKVSLQKVKEKWHIYPLEDIVENAENKFKRKLIVLPKEGGRNAIVDRLEKAVQAGIIQDTVWATPGLPFLIFVTLGLVLALFLGDIVWICLRLVLT